MGLYSPVFWYGKRGVVGELPGSILVLGRLCRGPELYALASLYDASPPRIPRGRRQVHSSRMLPLQVLHEPEQQVIPFRRRLQHQIQHLLPVLQRPAEHSRDEFGEALGQNPQSEADDVVFQPQLRVGKALEFDREIQAVARKDELVFGDHQVHLQIRVVD